MRTLHIVFLSFALCATTLAQTPAPAPYRVIVHGKSSVASIQRDFVADAFLKKVAHWPNGQGILPVDLDGDSPVRRKFSEEVLQRSVAAVRSYWQQLIFSGRNVPPPELDADQAVVEYVAKHKGAIGYVSGSAVLEGVRPVAVK